MKSETIAIHGGYDIDPTTKAVAVPIYQTVAYAFDSADHGAALFNLETPGFRYSRIANPTNAVLERRVAALEGGVEALAVGTGQAALNYASAQPHRTGQQYRFGAAALRNDAHAASPMCCRARASRSALPNPISADAIEKLIDDNTTAVFCESVGNPAGNICDIEALAEVAHRHGVPLIVDNTVATPILLQPFDYGADIVVHSLTKFMGGHGTTLGGTIVDSGNFPWKQHAERFPMFNEPDALLSRPRLYRAFRRSRLYRALPQRLSAHDRRCAVAVERVPAAAGHRDGWRCASSAMSRTPARVAEFLRNDPRVDWVNYAGFPDSPYHPLAQKYLGGRACSLLTFGVKGGLEAGKKFYDALQLFKRLVNIGDAKSLACHPASTTHRQMSAMSSRKPASGRKRSGSASASSTSTTLSPTSTRRSAPLAWTGRTQCETGRAVRSRYREAHDVAPGG